MFDLTGRPLLVLAILAAVLSLAGTVWLVVRRGDSGSLTRRLTTRAAPVVVLVVLGQGFAVGAVALTVNDQYDFYTSWADLTGHVAGNAAITTAGLVAAGQGQVQLVTLRHHPVGHDDRMLVWLPPQYQQAAYRARRFPVVMFLPGQPSSPQVVFRQFHFAQDATHAIATHQVPPFIAVFPTLMVAPPRDTECTDVPGGPRAETWLSRVVPRYLTRRFRTYPMGRDWTAMGWSTGGFCAAKLVTASPRRFGSAVSFGGYYQPIQDSTTGRLFGGRRTLELHNSPQWLSLHGRGLRLGRLLLIAGRQDSETWPSTAQMLAATAGDPRVSHVAFPYGGHNYANYEAYLVPGLRWASRSWHA